MHLHLINLPNWLNIDLGCATALLVMCIGTWRERLLSLGWIFPPVSSACTVWYAPRSEGLCSVGAPEPLTWLWMIDDVLLLVLWAVIVRRADRYPIVWAGSFLLLALISNALALLPGIGPWTMVSSTIVWWYLVGASLVWGSLAARSARSDSQGRPQPG